MNPAWIRALVLVCVFAAVVVAAEVLVRWIATNRAEGKAINLRLKMIGRGQSHGDTMNVLRRTSSWVPGTLPGWLEDLARRFERMLMQAQVTMPTPAADADHPGRAGGHLLPHAPADGIVVGDRHQFRPNPDQRHLRGRAWRVVADPRAELPGEPHPAEDPGTIPGDSRRVRSRASRRSPGRRRARFADGRNVGPDRHAIRDCGRRSDLRRGAARCAPEHGRTVGPRRHADVRRVAFDPE